VDIDTIGTLMARHRKIKNTVQNNTTRWKHPYRKIMMISACVCPNSNIFEMKYMNISS
jgi:hypothetical protein